MQTIIVKMSFHSNEKLSGPRSFIVNSRLRASRSDENRALGVPVRMISSTYKRRKMVYEGLQIIETGICLRGKESNILKEMTKTLKPCPGSLFKSTKRSTKSESFAI